MNIWAARRARAERLVAEAPHAQEILRCFAAVTRVQEGVAERIPVRRWLGLARSPTGDLPLLRLERLPSDELLSFFDDFLDAMATVGTPVMTDKAARLRGARAADRRTLLRRALASRGPDAADPGYHARTFLEAIATALGAAVGPATAMREIDGADQCRVCGGVPVVATLRDLPGALGTRTLVCGICGAEQRIRRLTCACCGETAADRLQVHLAESVPHVRLDECLTCRRYIKTVDLRRRGDAVPVVDELATVELDLWAKERGLLKVQPNVFGM